MFSGIVAGVGRVAEAAKTEHGRNLVIDTAGVGGGVSGGEDFLKGVAIGASIACDGVCLTVTATSGATFTADAGPETLALTTVGGWQAGRRINLERSLRLGDEMGGHLVLGHVDGRGTVAAATPGAGGTLALTIDGPAELAPLITHKGSVTVDGVSLTVNTVGRAADGGPGAGRFTVGLIKHTLATTRLDDLAVGDVVNLEVDMMARFAARLLEFRSLGPAS